MAFCSPLRQKRYLTGIDWVINTLDAMSKHAGGRGNSSQIILETKGNIDPARLRNLIDRMGELLPVLGGHVARAWNLCPYWRFNGRTASKIPLTCAQSGKSHFGTVFPVFQKHVNKPFNSKKEHLRFCLLNTTEGKAYLGMHFDHRLLDAFGAETFLELMAQCEQGRESEVLKDIRLQEPAHLDNWMRRFIGGRNTNRMQRSLSRDGMVSLPLKTSSSPRETLFEVVRFSTEETRIIKENLCAGPGFILALPSMLARTLKPLHQLIKTRNCNGPHYVIPVSVVRRTPDEIWTKMFFNHVSFLFFQVPSELVDSGQDLEVYLRNQLYEHIKAGLPEDIYHASMLTRIAPLSLLRLFSQIPLGGKVATNYFAFLKESGFESRHLLGAEIVNLIHTPHVPTPPGLGIFLNFFHDRLNLVVSYVEGLLQKDEASKLTERTKETLLD